MKQIITFITGTIIIGSVWVSKAQNAYLTVGGGYGLKLGSMAISANYSSSKFESVSSSFGKGILSNIGIGYSKNEHFAVELHVNYLLGSKVEFTDATSPTTPPENEILKGRMLRIIPAIRFSYGEKLKPYARIGLIVGVLNRLVDERTSYSYSWSSNYDTYHEISVFKGGLSLGFSGALGATYPLSDKLSLYGELGFMSQAWAPKKRIVTTYEVNGVDRLSVMAKRDAETEFVDSYDPSVSISPSEPDQSLKIYLPYSSWGVNVGIHYTLGKKKE